MSFSAIARPPSPSPTITPQALILGQTTISTHRQRPRAPTFSVAHTRTHDDTALPHATKMQMADYVRKVEHLFMVTCQRMRMIVEAFIETLELGLNEDGHSVPMIPTYVLGWPTRKETGPHLALDLGVTNVRVCHVQLLGDGKFQVTEAKYKLTEELKQQDGQKLFAFCAECLKRFLVEQYADEDAKLHLDEDIPLGFTFSYPCIKNKIDHAELIKWTKGFSNPNVEGRDVGQMLAAAIKEHDVPVKLTALVNDTTGTLMASSYVDPPTKIGVILGTGCNATYMEKVSNIPKIAQLGLPPDAEMAINCEWAAFDSNQHENLPRTEYDVAIDESSAKPGQRAFEKMVAGQYLGEIFRLVVIEMIEDGILFLGQNTYKIEKVYSFDTAFLSLIESDATDELITVTGLFAHFFGLDTTLSERQFFRRLAQLIGIRSARLSACGIAAIASKLGVLEKGCGVAIDGSLYNKYPQFPQRLHEALIDIFGEKGRFIRTYHAEDGCGLGSAVIAAMTKANQTLSTNNSGLLSSPSSLGKSSHPPPTRPTTAGSGGGAALTTTAPIFVPGGIPSPQKGAKSTTSAKLNMSAAEFEPSGLPPGDVSKFVSQVKDQLDQSNALYNPSSTPDPTFSLRSTSSAPFTPEQQYQAHNPYAYDDEHLHHHHHHHHHQDNSSFKDTYLAHVAGPSLSNFQRPLNYHLYAPPLPHSSNHHPDQLASNSFFMPASVRETLQRKSAATLQGPTHEVARSPEDLGVYHSLVVIDSPHSNANLAVPHGTVAPIGPAATKTSPSLHPPQAAPFHGFVPRSPYFSKVFKHPSWIYKAFCTLDGAAYCLFRIEGAQLQQGQGEAAIGQVERWRKIRHPAIVNVREAFTTRAFGDQSILFAFDYHPLSQTLYDEHISARKRSTFSFGSGADLEHDSLVRSNFNSNSRYQCHRPGNAPPGRSRLLKESTIWSYIVQLASAIKIVHSANLAVRTIDPTKILLTGANRVRINGCGILDVIEYSPNRPLEELQGDDLRDLGSVICSIASSSYCSTHNQATMIQGLEFVKQFYSQELNEVVDHLLKPPSAGFKVSIDGLLGMIWQRGFEEMTKVFSHNDLLEGYLMRELENGRLVRLMTKLGFINERPEFEHDPNWSETSDRYLIKLFRDYVFHQVDALGKPVTDLSHVLTCLNKLDASLDEKIMLISRNEQTCAVVSYAEIRRIIDIAYNDLTH